MNQKSGGAEKSALLVGCGPFSNRVNGLAQQQPNCFRTRPAAGTACHGSDERPPWTQVSNKDLRHRAIHLCPPRF